MTGVPGPLLVVRVLLVLWTGIVALVYFLSLVGLGVVEPAWFERQSGLTRGTVLALTVIVVLRLPFQVHVATPPDRGGPRTRLLVRLTVVFAYLCAAVDWANGVNPVLAVAPDRERLAVESRRRPDRRPRRRVDAASRAAIARVSGLETKGKGTGQ